MRNNLLPKLMLLITGFLLLFSACGMGENTEKIDGYSVLTYEEYANAIEEKEVKIIDVRSSGEYKNGHIPGALQANIESKEFEDKINALNLDKDAPVYIYCLSGNRSKKAAKEMEAMGFKNIVDLRGGIRAWKGDIVQ